MALIANGTTREDAAVSDLEKKLKHEKRFAREMKRQLNDITSDMVTFFKKNGSILRVDPYIPDIRKVLKDNYRLVSNDFKNTIRRSLGMKQDIGTDIDVQIAEFNSQKSQQVADQIAETTQKEAEKAFMDATAAIAVAGVILSDTAIAEEAGKTLNERNEKRSNTIAQTETQAVAEKSKIIEVETLAASAAVSAVLGAGRIKKVWNAILDGKTRAAHASADGQEVQITQPFIVGGERLNEPGDTSLGASAGNTINCRCSVDFVIS